MATTSMLTGNTLAVKRYPSIKAWRNVGMQSTFGFAASKGLIYFANDFVGQNTRGDQLTYSYLNKLTGIPVGEGANLSNNTEGLNLGNFQIAINTTRVGVSSPNKDTIEQQRSNVDFQKSADKVISDRHAELLDISFFYHAAGANPTSFTMGGATWASGDKLFVQGHNTPVAPSTGRIIRANSAATDQALTSSDKITLDMIAYAIEANDSSDQPIEPCDDGYFYMFVSPEQATDLLQDTTGSNQLWTLQNSLIQGGKENQIMQNKNTRFVGQFRNVMIYSAGRVAYGVNGSSSAVITSVRRAVLMGKDAITFASPYASSLSDADAPFDFFSQTDDFEYYRAREGRFIGGLKKTVPSNGLDVGTIVLSTYAAAHY